MGLFTLGYFYPLYYCSWTTLFQIKDKRTNFSPVHKLDRFHVFGPFQLKLWVQGSSNYGCQGLFSMGTFTSFTAVAETDVASSFWLKTSQEGWRRDQIKFPFWSLNRRSTGTRLHSIISASPSEANDMQHLLDACRGPSPNTGILL